MYTALNTENLNGSERSSKGADIPESLNDDSTTLKDLSSPCSKNERNREKPDIGTIKKSFFLKHATIYIYTYYLDSLQTYEARIALDGQDGEISFGETVLMTQNFCINYLSNIY